MLDIIVSGKKIAIQRGTAIQMELNNNIFSTDGIEGDVAYSFDVPAAHNDLIFDSARFVYVQRRRKYDCTILLAGTPIGNGNLYVTKATKDTYSCEVAVNAFPDGWRDRKLRDNDYGDDIIISETYENHKAGWLSFLRSTLSENSVVKFPLFLDEEYYDDNEDFGFQGGYKNMPIGLIGDFARNCRFVNRLAYIVINNVKNVWENLLIDTLGGTSRALTNRFEIFNATYSLENGNIERNQVSFAPALSVAFMLRKVFSNAKYNIIGNYINSKELATIFFQSLRSMDSTVREEYIKHDGYVQCSLHETIASVTTVTRDILPLGINEQDDDEYELFDGQSHTYTISQDGTHLFTFKGRFCADINHFTPAHAGVFIIREYPSTELPQTIIFNSMDDETYSPDPNYGFVHAEVCPFYAMGSSYPPKFSHFCELHDISASSYAESDEPSILEVQFSIVKDFSAADIGKELSFSFFMGMMGTPYANGFTIGPREDLSMDAVMQVYAVDACMSNVFKRVLKYAEYMPSMTNSDFINALKQCHGLSVYFDSFCRTVELSFFKDQLNAGQIDLSPFVLQDETQVNHNELKNMVFELPPIDEPSEDEERLEDVEFMTELSQARINIGRASLVKHLNEIYKAERVEDTEKVWSDRWQRSGGNRNALKIFSTDEENTENIKPNCKIPSVEFISSAAPTQTRLFVNTTDTVAHPISDSERTITEKLHFLEINGQCISFLNKNTGKTDGIPLILIRYIGDESLPVHTDYDKRTSTYYRRSWIGDVYIQRFSPVCYNNDNQRVPGKDLTATGEHSIGEVYVKPWLKLLSNYEKITYRFLLPPAKLLEVIQLFRPQDAAPSQQVRWIFVENIRVLPIRMTFEIVEGKDQILTEIECAKQVMEN